MNRANSLQERIDALKRKCSTGYGCGATCISLQKECRTRPGSAIGKERLKRLMALAGGAPSSQRGIGTLKAGDAGKLAEGITARRGEKAGQLRGARQQAAAAKAQAAQAAEAAATGGGGGGGGSTTEKGGALVRQQQPQERKQQAEASTGSAADQKYAGKADDASVTAYAKEKVKELLDDPKQWENSEFVKKYTKDDYFGHATMVGDDAKALRALNSFMQGQLKTRQAELDRGYSFATDRPEDIEKQLEKAKVSKAKNKAQKINYLTHKLADAKQQLENARVFVEETYPRMNAMSNNEKVASARDRARKRVETVVGRGMRDLKSAARGGKEVAAVADFLRVEQGGRSKGVSQLLGEDVANDKDVIRAQLTGKGTAEGVLGLRPGQKPSREALKSAYRKAAAKTHPDAGGSPEEFRMTQQAYKRLKKKFSYDSLQHRIDALRARCTPLNG